jgi:putative ABC transport system permease protein
MTFATELKEGLAISWGAIRANKMRAALTTLGIVIGIVTVTLMATAIQGLNRAFRQSISVLGTDVLYVQRGSWFIRTYEEWLKVDKRKEITLQHVRALEKQLTLARAIAPVAATRQSVRFKNQNANGVMILGTTEQFLYTGGTTVNSGRFFTSSEVEGGRPLCLIGFDVASKLFRNEQPIGKQLQISGRAFEVIGVLEKQGSFMGQFSLDNQVIIPLRQMVFNYYRRPDFQIQIKAISEAQLDDAREEIRGVMRKARRLHPGDEDDFAINQQDMFINTFNRVAGTIATAGLFITGLSLFVGGIGIMNIMFVSVAERTREIGIRKAIGAKRRTILLQFLTEASAICFFGGLLALSIAWPLTYALGRMIPATMSLPVAALAIAVSLLTGVASGFFPAWRAARMNPVDALRNE